MKIKKLLLVLLLSIIMLGVVACGSDPNGGGSGGSWKDRKITLKFATWQYCDAAKNAVDNLGFAGTIDTLLVNAFMKKYPNVTVEMQIVGEDNQWDRKMQALAQSGDLPDVFLIYRLETALPYRYLADITEFYEKDPDTENIFSSLQTAGTFGGNRYAVPTYFYPELWYVNLDILQANGIDKPSYNWTWDQMEAIAQTCYNESQNISGLYGVDQYYKVLPKILSGNANWASYTYDGTKFNFDSPFFSQAMTKLTDALTNNTVTMEYSKEQKHSLFGEAETFKPAYNGYAAIWAAPVWEAKEYLDKMNFNWDAYPAPGGSVNGNIDLIGVSSTCAEKEAAYELLKWMSYSKEGLETRYKIYEAAGETLFKSANNYPYPVVDYGIDAKTGENSIWDHIPYDAAPGMSSAALLEAIRNAAIWGNKEVCGWDTTNKALYNYFYQVVSGAKTLEDNLPTIIDLANPTFNEFRTKLAQILAGEIDIEDLFPHVCSHVCPTCGKCTDLDCVNAVCEEKCTCEPQEQNQDPEE